MAATKLELTFLDSDSKHRTLVINDPILNLPKGEIQDIMEEIIKLGFFKDKQGRGYYRQSVKAVYASSDDVVVFNHAAKKSN